MIKFQRICVFLGLNKKGKLICLMKRPKVSIIIPVYNASERIIRTSENLVSQTLDDIEVLYVENDSSDDSSSLAGMQANKYRQIRFYKEFTPGVSAARNLGIEKAKGDFLIFMDDDDLQSDEITRCLYNAIEGVDMSICGCEIIENGNKVYSTPEEMFRVLDGKSVVKGMFAGDESLRYIWNKMFRRDIIDKYNIRFEEGVHYYEDVLFLVDYLTHCKNVRQVPYVHYTFFKGQSEAAKLQFKDGKPTERALTAIKGYFEILDKVKQFEDNEMIDSVKKTIVKLELELVDKMLDNTDYQTYKNSPFRQYAKRSLRFRYKPENDNEAFLYNKLKRYILTGNTKRG